MKKLISVALAACIAVCLAVCAQGAEPLRYVVLGDSVAEGSGVYNSSEACYGRIIADTCGYDYANFGVNGHRSADLVGMLSREDVAAAVADADIISISIGGNDFLQQNIPVLLADAARGDYHHLDNIEAALLENIGVIIGRIRQLRPDAVILMQNMYNVHSGMLGQIYDFAIPRINRAIGAYLEDNPGAYYVVDVASAFAGHPEYVAVDTIHPTAVGNVELARCVLTKLCELGLADTAEPVVKSTGIDEIPFTSYILKKILDFFRRILSFFR